MARQGENFAHFVRSSRAARATAVRCFSPRRNVCGQRFVGRLAFNLIWFDPGDPSSEVRGLSRVG
jgi:hypothetical protein